MPRLKNGTPNYCKHKASGQAVVTLNGRDFYLGKHGTAASRREYERLIGQWLASGRTLTDEGHDVTITEVMVDDVKKPRPSRSLRSAFLVPMLHLDYRR